ncbi:hypothetical protein AB0J72_40330 [Dactylosporangium sp. NPDC049742]|uniref:hypothetical protein n=1 Tax=Dactylosporangium sp. NPDC049742 TaxID=3154737 RepID=UPI00341D2361
MTTPPTAILVAESAAGLAALESRVTAEGVRVVARLVRPGRLRLTLACRRLQPDLVVLERALTAEDITRLSTRLHCPVLGIDDGP